MQWSEVLISKGVSQADAAINFVYCLQGGAISNINHMTAMPFGYGSTESPTTKTTVNKMSWNCH